MNARKSIPLLVDYSYKPTTLSYVALSNDEVLQDRTAAYLPSQKFRARDYRTGFEKPLKQNLLATKRIVGNR